MTKPSRIGLGIRSLDHSQGLTSARCVLGSDNGGLGRPCCSQGRFGCSTACLMTFFSAATGNGSVTLRLMQPVPVFMRGYLALNSAMWWAPLVYSAKHGASDWPGLPILTEE
jgi:hypothetical protein